MKRVEQSGGTGTEPELTQVSGIGVSITTLLVMSDAAAPPASVDRVIQALVRAGVSGQVRALDDSARTAKEAASALGIEVGQIASSLVFMAAGEPVLVVASGAHRVDTSKVAALLDVAALDKATADDVRAATGFAIGGVSPVGHPAPLRTIVDIALAQFDEVWAAGGHPHYVFPTTFDELVRITGGTPADIGA